MIELAYIPELSASQMKRIKKKIYKMFKNHGLKITIETNLPKVNFLDITMDLTSGTIQPFRKPNDNPLYNIIPNPHHIIKNLPTAINKRLSEISSNNNKNFFNMHKKRISRCTQKLWL